MTVVFFCPNILRDVHRDIFNLDRLKDEGYNFILLDATEYYNHKSTAIDKLILDNRVKCDTKEDFITFKNKFSQGPVLYVTFDQYMKFAAPILNILVRKQDKLLSFHTKRFSSAQFPSNKTRIFFDKVVVKLDKFLPLHYCKPFYKWKHKLYIPDYYLCSTSYLMPTKAYFTIKKNRRIIMHSDDVNHIINNRKPVVIDKNKKTGVFLDQVIPFQDRLHPLLVKEAPPKGYIDTYYTNLENTLNDLKKKFKLDEVVIALHPDAVKLKEELSDKFNGLRTFIGATNELIRDSQVVFGHSSTALGFAIFYKKPIILLKDKVLMNESHIRKFILFYEETLGLKTIYMDSPNKVEKDIVSIDDKKYSDYIRKFMKENDIQENSFYYAIKKVNQDLDSKK